MSATATTNGKHRKQLSDQLDRLDGIIDALAEGLNAAVADAAREGTRLAVQGAIVEILTNPDLRAAIRQATGDGVGSGSPAPAPTPPSATPRTPARLSFWAQAKAKFAGAKEAVLAAVTPAVAAAVGTVRAAKDAVASAARAVPAGLRVRRLLLVGL